MVIVYDGGKLECSKIKTNGDILMADGIWVVPLEEVEEIRESEGK